MAGKRETEAGNATLNRFPECRRSAVFTLRLSLMDRVSGITGQRSSWEVTGGPDCGVDSCSIHREGRMGSYPRFSPWMSLLLGITTRPVHEIDGPAPLESRLSSSGESDTWTTSKCFLIRFHCRCSLSESSYRLLSSPVSLPFSATHFLGPLLRANSCVLQLRGLCFPGSALNSIWVPSHKAAARFGSRSHSPLGGPKKMGQEKGENSVMSYLRRSKSR